jgi:hypothetical protein
MSKALQKKDQLDPVQQKIHHETKEYNDNTKKIKGLLAIDTPVKEIHKILDLHPKTVEKRIREIRNRNLNDSKFVDLAAKALTNNLNDNNMQAVKMVYDRVHPKQPETKVVSGSKADIKITLDITRLKSGDVSQVVEVDSFDDRENDVIDVR